jgi:hypothetical protein
MAASNLRFGAHATREVGQDFSNMISQLPAAERSGAKIGVFTDPNVAKLPVMEVVEESLVREGLNWVVWDKCAVEPTDKSWQVCTISASPLPLSRIHPLHASGANRVCRLYRHLGYSLNAYRPRSTSRAAQTSPTSSL